MTLRAFFSRPARPARPGRPARRAAVLLAVTGALVAGVAAPASAVVVTSAVCRSFDTNVPGYGLSVSMPSVHLSPGEKVYMRGVAVSIDGTAHAGSLFYTEYGMPNWLYQLPPEFNSEWRTGPAVNDTRDASLSLTGAGLVVRAYIDLMPVARGQWERTAVLAADGSEWCRS
jgi:hypothetical protein